MKIEELREKYYNFGISDGYFNLQLVDIENLSSELIKGYLQGVEKGQQKQQIILGKGQKKYWETNRESYLTTIGQNYKKYKETMKLTTDFLSSEDYEMFFEAVSEKDTEEASVKPNKEAISFDDYIERKRVKTRK